MQRRTIKSAFLDPAGLRFASLSFASTFCFLEMILIVFETIHSGAEPAERAPRICNHTVMSEQLHTYSEHRPLLRTYGRCLGPSPARCWPDLAQQNSGEPATCGTAASLSSPLVNSRYPGTQMAKEIHVRLQCV